jgi:hypothetical protein
MSDGALTLAAEGCSSVIVIFRPCAGAWKLATGKKGMTAAMSRKMVAVAPHTRGSPNSCRRHVAAMPPVTA